MKKITRIVGVDCKIGKNSRSASTVTMSISDEDIIDCTKYYKEFNSADEIEGKIKKITLILEYEEDLKENLGDKITEITMDLAKVTDEDKPAAKITDYMEKSEKTIVDIDGALSEVVDGEEKE